MYIIEYYFDNYIFSPGPREQLNQATHWLDASMVYGVTKEDNDKLRDLSNRGMC